MERVTDSDPAISPPLVNAAELAELGIFEPVIDDRLTRPWTEPPPRPRRKPIDVAAVAPDPRLKRPSVHWAETPTADDRAWFSGYCAGREGLEITDPADVFGGDEPEMLAFYAGNVAGRKDRDAIMREAARMEAEIALIAAD